MNDQTSIDDLPELSDDAIARMENSVFAQIAEERSPSTPTAVRSRVRRRRWLTGAGIAAAFALGVLVTPPILGAVGSGTVMSTADGTDMSGGSVADSIAGSPERSAEMAPGDVSSDAPSTLMGTDTGDADRDIVTTANVTLQVKDIPAAAAAVTALAEEHGGYVESTQVGKALATDDTSAPAPPDQGYGWISVRVPSADLTDVIGELGDSGEVIASSISKQDVTATAIDLRARVEATKASVARLSELMAQSGSVSELIEAEVALTDRQAQLESWEQQLAAVEDQVAMSTVQVELTRAAAPTSADPAGFADGLLAGWNGLVVSLNALVIAVGFILPWLGIAAVVVLIVWLIRRARRARRDEAVSAENTAD
ncbi:DUF4349 domain-containing protein [Microbacterium sp. LWO12-1.2]|uniref:DUF4349 domain-containing protein n=1 Tax=Microbacterium sp. LWO12-1.2 TaxID=3135261 RepID=UPI0034307D1C